MLQRRITELEQALDRCQKRLEIPTVALTAHPEVETIVNKVGEGRKVDLEALGLAKRVRDDAFLNQVQVKGGIFFQHCKRCRAHVSACRRRYGAAHCCVWIIFDQTKSKASYGQYEESATTKMRVK